MLQYDKVCREIQSLKADAILLESNLRAEIAELRRERDEALNAAKWLKQDLDRIQNERTSAALEAKLKDSLAVINILYRELQVRFPPCPTPRSSRVIILLGTYAPIWILGSGLDE